MGPKGVSWVLTFCSTLMLVLVPGSILISQANITVTKTVAKLQIVLL